MYTRVSTLKRYSCTSQRRLSLVSELFSRWKRPTVGQTINKAKDYVDFKGNPPAPSVMDYIRLFPDFITQEEHDALFSEVDPELNLRRYQPGHWDKVAKKYREIEKFGWAPENQAVLDRIKTLDEIENKKMWGNYVHVLDVKKEGEIGLHVDNKEAFGCTIAGISLLSESVMTMENKETGSIIELYLPPKSLYIISDDIRYQYAHGILETPFFKGKPVNKERRISIILRTRTKDKDCLHQ